MYPSSLVRAMWIVLAGFSATVQAEDTRQRVNFGRNCAVYRKPSINAPEVCRGAKGTPIKRYRSNRDGYYLIETDTCRGYVTDSCLSFERRRWEGRNLSSMVDSGSQGVWLGLTLDGQGLFARAAGLSSSGYGVGGGILLSFPLGSRFRLALLPQYRYLQLSLSVDGSGVVTDTPGEFTQRIPHLGMGVMGSFLLSGMRRTAEPAWWLDAGAEYLFPLSARQVDRQGTLVAFEPTDRLLFAFLGVSGEFFVSRKFSVVTYLQALYNVASAGNSRILAGRFAASFVLTL